MTAVTSISLLPLLATAPAAEALSMIEAQRAAITSEEAVTFQNRLKGQVVGASSPFFDKVDQLRRLLRSTSPEKAKQIPGAKIQIATAWNDLDTQLKLDAQIAAAQTQAGKHNLEADLGVIGPNGEGADKFHNPHASVVATVNPTGPLGTVAMVKLFRDYSPTLYGMHPSPEHFEQMVRVKLRGVETLLAAQLFFLSALMLSSDWRDLKPGEGWVPLDDLSIRLDQAADALYAAGQRRPRNLYLDDVISLRKAAVKVAIDPLKPALLAEAQNAIAESLEPRAEEAQPNEDQLIQSALYLLDAAANWNNAQETEAARRAFDRSVGLLRLAGRLPE